MTENKTQTPRPPITKEEFHPPWIYPEEYKEKELSTEQNPITTTVSSGDTSVVFEKPGTGSMMAVSVIPNIDQSKKTVKVIYDDELVRKKAKIFFKGEVTADDAVKHLVQFGGRTEEISELNDFLGRNLRTSSTEKEITVAGGVDSKGPHASAKYRKKETTDK